MTRPAPHFPLLPYDLSRAPELGSLALWQEALHISVLALVAEHPTLQNDPAPDEPPCLRRARRLLASAGIFRNALDKYRNAVYRALILHGPIGDLGRCARSLLQRLSDRGVSASLGLAYTTATEFVPARAELRQLAEAACRQAKRQGGGCVMLAGQGLVAAFAGQDCNHADSAGEAQAMPHSAAQGLSASPLSARQPAADGGRP